jgi:hypothetical protein
MRARAPSVQAERQLVCARVVRGGAYLGDVEGVDEDGGDDGGSGRRNGAFGESHGPLCRWRRRWRGSPRGGHGEEGEGTERGRRRGN